MHANREERRKEDALSIVAISRDETWLAFTRRTLRRTDKVEVVRHFQEITNHLSSSDKKVFLLISSELVPDKIVDFEDSLDGLPIAKVCVLRESHDEHHRISDKHLRRLGAIVEDRPENHKAMRRLIKILVD